MNRWVIGSLARTRLAGHVRSIIGTKMRNRIARRLSDADLDRALKGESANLDDIEAFIAKHTVPLRAPLVLISQVQRSGGTLLNQLFDGHPALAVYPHELRFGYDKAKDRLAVNPELGADENFRLLFDRKVLGFVKDGFTKGVRDPNRYRFFMVPRIQRAVFRAVFEREAPSSQREVMDCFFTAFFNAWLDYQGSLEPKRWLTAFAPRFVHELARATAFFDCYPDGRLIQIIRDPFSWYPSAKRHGRSLRKDFTPEDLREIWIEFRRVHVAQQGDIWRPCHHLALRRSCRAYRRDHATIMLGAANRLRSGAPTADIQLPGHSGQFELLGGRGGGHLRAARTRKDLVGERTRSDREGLFAGLRARLGGIRWL